MNRPAAAIREVLRHGRFVSRWSLGASAVLAVTVMAPRADGGTPLTVLCALVAGWMSFAATLIVVGTAERTLRNARVRSAVVVTGIVLAAAGRPAIQDAWLVALGMHPPAAWQLPFRILTNVIVWVVVLTTIALIVDALRSLRATNALLASVIAELDSAQENVSSFAAHARQLLQDATVELRAMVASLRTDPDAEAARIRLIEGLRMWSHELDRLPDPESAGPASAAEAQRPMRTRMRVRPVRRPWAPLRVPPRGVVSSLYAACMLPYALRTASPGQILVAVAVLILGDYLVDRVSRDRRLAAGRVASPVVFLLLSAVVGGALSVPTGPHPSLVPAAVYGALAAGSAVCAGATHRLRVERRRLSRAVSAEQRATRTATTPARDALRDAAELLHRDAQSACVVFGLEHPHPSPADRAELARRVDAVLDRMAGVFDVARSGVDASSLDLLLATWSRVIELRVYVGPGVRTVLDEHSAVTRDTYEIVAEGLLNAVKHAGAQPATLTLDLLATGAGRAVRIRMLTARTMAAAVDLRPASHIRSLGASVRVTPEGVLLEAAIPVRGGADRAAVVSAEHPGTEPVPRP